MQGVTPDFIESKRSVDPVRGAPPVEDAAERCPVKGEPDSLSGIPLRGPFEDSTRACILFVVLSLLSYARVLLRCILDRSEIKGALILLDQVSGRCGIGKFDSLLFEFPQNL